MKLNYRMPTLNDEKIIYEYVDEHLLNGETYIGGAINLLEQAFSIWISCNNKKYNFSDSSWGTCYTLLCFDSYELIGMINLRCQLVPELQYKFGNIGYGVRPSKRRRGYATRMLKYALNECRKHNMQDVIIGSYKSNIGSIKTIKKNNGILIKEDDSYKKGKVGQYFLINLV